MFQSIRQLAERISSIVAERPFSCGFLTGLAVAFAILVFFCLLSLILRPRKLRCVVIPSPEGDLRIDAKAVQGAVRSVAENFPAFDVRRVGLFGKQDAVELDVAMDFNGGDASVSELAAQFRAAVHRMMVETFGTKKPARIEVEILRSGADIPASGETDGVKDPEEECPSVGEPSAPEPGQPC